MRHTATARALHWTTAAIMAVVIALGLFLGFGPETRPAVKFAIYNIHESTGLVLLALTLARLWWRARHPPPPLDPTLPAAQRLAAHLNHAGLYALLIVMPVTGFLATNAWGFPLTWFWMVPIPSPIGKHEALAPVLQAIHNASAFGIIVLIGLHVAAAGHHHLIRRDDTLRRML